VAFEIYEISDWFGSLVNPNGDIFENDSSTNSDLFNPNTDSDGSERRSSFSSAYSSRSYNLNSDYDLEEDLLETPGELPWVCNAKRESLTWIADSMLQVCIVTRSPHRRQIANLGSRNNQVSKGISAKVA
jgi:hypothetical protein